MKLRSAEAGLPQALWLQQERTGHACHHTPPDDQQRRRAPCDEKCELERKERESRSLARRTDGASARRELAQLHRLRESAWRVLGSVAAGRAAEGRELAALSAAMRWALAQASFEQDARAFRWSVREKELGLQLVRARLALALLDLLSRRDLERLRECGRCTGLFLDHGRGVGRRWCRMNTCGNRAKTERFRSRSAS